jgi:hypothetical protein
LWLWLTIGLVTVSLLAVGAASYRAMLMPLNRGLDRLKTAFDAQRRYIADRRP